MEISCEKSGVSEAAFFSPLAKLVSCAGGGSGFALPPPTAARTIHLQPTDTTGCPWKVHQVTSRGWTVCPTRLTTHTHTVFVVDIPVTAMSVVFSFRVVSTFSSGFFDEEELILVQLKRRQLAAALAATTTGAQDDRTDKSIGFTWAAHIARLDEAEFKRRYRLTVS